MPINRFHHDPNYIKGRKFCTSVQSTLDTKESLILSADQLQSSCITHLPTLILHHAFILHIEGKMRFYLYSIFTFICHIYQHASTKLKPELKKNILNSGYSMNYKYEHMLARSFVRFHVVTKFILPSIGDLNFSTLNYNNTCTYLDNKNVHHTDSKKHMLDLMTFCKKI